MLLIGFSYTLICAAVLLLTVLVAEVDFSSFRHHRIREISHFISVQSMKESIINKQVSGHKRSAADDVDDWLRLLDYPLGLSGRKFMFLTIISILLFDLFCVFGIVGSTFYKSIHSSSLIGLILFWLLFLFVSFLLFVLPLFALRAMANRRKRKIQRQFIFLLNSFSMFLRMRVSPEAIVSQTIKMIENPLRSRLIQLYAEIQVLGPREAFTRFSDKLTSISGDFSKNREYKIFKDSIINALDFGTDASESCDNLSKDLRLRRKNENIKLVQRKPFLIILPKILFAISILILVAIPLLQKLFEFVYYG